MTNDVTSPAALLFVDAIGETLPSRTSFTFKELSDFCSREGVNGLVNSKDPLTSDTLVLIARKIAAITKGHVTVEPRPTVGKQRMPLSKVDMDVADHVASIDICTCRKCGAATNYLLFCNACREVTADMLFGAPAPPRPNKKHVPAEKKKHSPIEMGASVVLDTGLKVHVVAISDGGYVGVDDELNAHDFMARQAVDIKNLTDPITKQAAWDSCPTCGEGIYGFEKECRVCGYGGE